MFRCVPMPVHLGASQPKSQKFVRNIFKQDGTGLKVVNKNCA